MSELASPAARFDGPDSPVGSNLSSINAVFGMSLVLAQASSPAQAMRLVTTAVSSIAVGHRAFAWHPSASGDHFGQAPNVVADSLRGLTGPARLEMEGVTSCWAFPMTSSLGREPIVLVTAGDTELAEEDRFLLSILAQMCGTVLAHHQVAVEAGKRAQADRARDVATARAAELEASESRQRAILDAALDAVVTIDERGVVRYVNRAFERTFGYRSSEVIGQPLADMIVPPSLRDTHRQGFSRYLATGETRILDQRVEVAAMRADRSEFLAELTVTRADSPGATSFVGYLRDITERRRAQQELMASRARLVAASDSARQRVTRDLHDGAQQRFVTSLINLKLARRKWAASPHDAEELLGQAIAEMQRGINDLREIAAGIYPAILTQRGLAPAISGMAAGLPIPIEVDVPDQRFPDSIESSVYLWCAEALTNVVKHARASAASVHIQHADGQCRVEVRDNGIGGIGARFALGWAHRPS